MLPLEAAREVLRVGRETAMDALVSDDPHGKGVLIYDHISEDNHALAKYIAWSRRIHGDEAEDAVRRVPSLEDYLDHAPLHISFSGSCAMMSSLRERLAEEIGDDIKVVSTEYPKLDLTLLDVLHPEASKGVGVAAAAREYGLKREEIMAIGDNFNDLEMLHYAGTGVLMGNADSSLRDLTDFHQTVTNDEDGVAVAIEKFIFEKQV